MSSPLTANAVDAAALADELARYRVLEPARLTDLLSEFPGGGPVALAEFLVGRGVLTPFQADRALAGEARLLALGPYRPNGPGGPGTFGPVYAAAHKDRPGTFRVRVFPLRSLWRARQAKQLARTLGDAPHPAVVPLADADSANGFHYLAWPHADGESLADRVAARGPLAPGEAVGVLAHLADALHACHARRVVHGTLTPRSVVLGPGGVPRLLELGAGAVLAQNLADDESLLDTLSAAVATAGMLEYAAPEVVTDPAAGPAADQYALGALGYFVLTGRPPFPAASLTERLFAGRSGPRPLREVNPSVPADLAAVIDRMLRPRPADRFTGLDEVHDRFGAVATRSELISDPPAAVESPPDPLPLSVLRDPVRVSGVIAWPPVGSGATPAPGRDDSAASITFDLPDAEPDPAVGLADAPLQPAETPSRAVAVTQPSRRLPEPEPVPPADEATGPAPAPLPFLRKSAPPVLLPASPKSPRTTPPDPRRDVGAPVHWHTEDPAAVSGAHAIPPLPDADEPPPAESVLWKKVKRNLLFWQAPTDVIQVSVFGPASAAPGQSAKISVYLHTADAADSVRTLSRAFHHDAELIGTGSLAQPVARQTPLAVHLSVANAGVSKSLLKFSWRGQPHRLTFDLHVPWESPGGVSPGLVSVGRDDVRIGKVEFRLRLLPRKG